MSRAFLVDRRTGEAEPIQIDSSNDVRRYFASSDDVYGKTMKQEDGSVVRVWKTRDTAQHIEVFTAHDRRAMEMVDLLELPDAARIGLEVSL